VLIQNAMLQQSKEPAGKRDLSYDSTDEFTEGTAVLAKARSDPLCASGKRKRRGHNFPGSEFVAGSPPERRRHMAPNDAAGRIGPLNLDTVESYGNVRLVGQIQGEDGLTGAGLSKPGNPDAKLGRRRRLGSRKEKRHEARQQQRGGNPGNPNNFSLSAHIIKSP